MGWCRSAHREAGFVRAGSDAENMIEEEHAASRRDARFLVFVKFHFFFLGATTDQSWITPESMTTWFIWTLSNRVYRSTGTILLSTLLFPTWRIPFIDRVCVGCFFFPPQHLDVFFFKGEIICTLLRKFFFFSSAQPNWPWLQRSPAPSSGRRGRRGSGRRLMPAAAWAAPVKPREAARNPAD